MIKDRKKLPKFILGKSISDARHGYSKLGYRKKYELCIIAVLVCVIFVFRFSTHLDLEKYLNTVENTQFEFFEIMDIPVIVEPPQLQMENVVEIVEEEKVEEELTEMEEIIEEIEEMLGDDSAEPQLTLASAGMENYLLASSQLGAVKRTQFQGRGNLALGDNNLSLGADGRYVDESGGGLDIGATKTQRRGLESGGGASNLDLNIEKKTKARPKREAKEESTNGTSLNFEGKKVKVLSFSSTTIGTEGYKLWNKIISELDRLNKGRYGIISDQIQRRRNGFIISFGFPDNSAQEINWRNNGNISIKVIGNSSKTTVQELQRALSGLLRLSL